MFKTLQSLYSHKSGNNTENKKVLILELNVHQVRDDASSGGRLFHVLADATENARSPTVQRNVDGTTGAEVDEERKAVRTNAIQLQCIADVLHLCGPLKRRRPGRSVTRYRVSVK